jgi:hypothetical protein
VKRWLRAAETAGDLQMQVRLHLTTERLAKHACEIFPTNSTQMSNVHDATMTLIACQYRIFPKQNRPNLKDRNRPPIAGLFPLAVFKSIVTSILFLLPHSQCTALCCKCPGHFCQRSINIKATMCSQSSPQNCMRNPLAGNICKGSIL